MGLPGFVSWLRKEYGDRMIVKSVSDHHIKTLYIDANCLIHPKCFEVVDANPRGDIEIVMFRRICRFIDYLIEYVQPDSWFVAVDGSAPRTKLKQQRDRRYKSVTDTEMINTLKRKHGQQVTARWSNTVITPGTVFMERLHQYLLRHFATYTKPGIYSSYHTAGEGEHKILEHIRKTASDEPCVIYGLDADLFFLAMASMRPNIYLLREEQHFTAGRVFKREITDIVNDVAEDMRFVSIDTVKECYDETIERILHNRGYVDRIRGDYWIDFIFICYFLGNDFLPHIPTIDIHKSGLDIIIDCYIDVLTRLSCRFVDDTLRINNVFLIHFLRELSGYETVYFKRIVPEHRKKLERRTCTSTNAYEIELFELQNMRFPVWDPVQLGVGTTPEWKSRYYSYYFGVNEHAIVLIDQMCQSYLEGLVWVSRYYFDKCPSWSWQYPFTHAPFISDIYAYLEKSAIDVNTVSFDVDTPLVPCVQLMCVLPPSCADQLATAYQALIRDKKSPVGDMFPEKCAVDMIGKDMHWMCVPILPYLDIERINTAICDLRLSESEVIRNSELNEFIFGK